MHTGGVDGLTALLAMLPEELAGVVVLANASISLSGQAARSLSVPVRGDG
jgi:hypothetical protein